MLEREEEKAAITEAIRKDIGEFLWKACSYLLEEDEELFIMVRVELEPAIRLSREIIEELQDSNRELIEKSIKEGKDEKEIETELMVVFALPREKAMEKINCCHNRNTECKE